MNDPNVVQGLEERVAQLQAQVQALMVAVEQAHRLGSLGVLAATVAHEINNILTPVQGYALSALARPEDRALATRALTRAAEGAERGAQLARSVLALAGEAAAPESSGGVQVGAAVEEAVDLCRRVLDDSGVVVQVEGDASVVARAARCALVQVVQNLLLNAASAMRGRGGCVWIAWGRAGDDVELLVRDDGPGIAAGVRERMFTPFATARGGDGGGVRLGGSGLGLSICKRLVESAGGRIEVESVVGEGTTFRIVIPARP